MESKNRVLIIAEAGVNHNGDLNLAKQLITIAAESGADIVKFQTFKADSLVSKSAKKAAYQSVNLNDGNDSQYEMLKKLEIPLYWYPELIQCCQKNRIGFLSTAFDEESVDFLEQFDPGMYKIPSGEITNKPYLQCIANKGRPVVLSTGMANIDEVKAAVKVLLDGGVSKSQLTVLHCNTEYATPLEDVNLLAMKHIQRELDVNIGYSDHTLGIEVSVAAVALGATIIEKHFTLDRNLPGPDHAASLKPDELKAMVWSVRNIEKAISGSGIKEPSKSEKNNIPIARKSLYINKKLEKGTVVTNQDLITLRPGDGISPMLINQVVGKRLVIDVNASHKIFFEDLE
jgi:N,N'-diacetyllegionaminate synthase